MDAHPHSSCKDSEQACTLGHTLTWGKVGHLLEPELILVPIRVASDEELVLIGHDSKASATLQSVEELALAHPVVPHFLHTQTPLHSAQVHSTQKKGPPHSNRSTPELLSHLVHNTLGL